MAITKHVKHIRSSVADSIPTTEQLDYGEIAINYSTDKERLFIKNANNEIVPFYSGKVIEENERVTAAALADLDSRVDNLEENNVNTENMESVTHSELKSKRDNGELVPGKHYRITDYITTTSQENTQSAGHQFDVVVLALDERTLSENAHAMLHEGDTYFSTNGADLSAWELKYCLDNDTNRFAWAVGGEQKELRLYKADGYAEEDGSYPMDKGENHIDRSEWFSYIGPMDYNGNTYYAWRKHEFEGATNYVILTNALYHPGDLNPGTNDIYDGSNPDFNGVAADVAYTLTMDGDTTNDYEGLNHNSEAMDEYVCLCEYGEVSGEDSVVFEVGGGNGVIYYMKDEWNNECPYDFKNIQFKRKLNNGVLDTTNGDDTFVYTFNLWRINAQKIEDASIIGNTLENDAGHISGVYGNKINHVSESNVYSEQTSFEVTQYLLNDNVFLNTDEFGFFNGCYANILGYDCLSNTFGNGCNNNTFGNGCLSNTFGNYCLLNTFGNDCVNNTFGNSCWTNTFGNDCSLSIFGNSFHHNSFGDYCESNTFGNAVNHVTFSKDYTHNVIVENGNQYITLTSTATTDSSNHLRNITIAQGVNNTKTNKEISHNSVNDTFKTTYQPVNSVTVSV